MRQVKREFWTRYPGLVWSNPQADDSVHIRAALLQPRFNRLLDIALEFGIDRLWSEWNLLKAENTPQAQRAQVAVERILNHIQEGLRLATSGN